MICRQSRREAMPIRTMKAMVTMTMMMTKEEVLKHCRSKFPSAIFRPPDCSEFGFI
jgi:hypothetical protein